MAKYRGYVRVTAEMIASMFGLEDPTVIEGMEWSTPDRIVKIYFAAETPLTSGRLSRPTDTEHAITTIVDLELPEYHEGVGIQEGRLGTRGEGQ